MGRDDRQTSATSGLDGIGVRALVGAVDSEVARGAVVVVVTHDVDTFRGMPTRRVAMEAGRVTSVEEPASLVGVSRETSQLAPL